MIGYQSIANIIPNRHPIFGYKQEQIAPFNWRARFVKMTMRRYLLLFCLYKANLPRYTIFFSY